MTWLGAKTWGQGLGPRGDAAQNHLFRYNRTHDTPGSSLRQGNLRRGDNVLQV